MEIEEMIDRLGDLRLSLKRRCTREAVLELGLIVDELGYRDAARLANRAIEHGELLREAIEWHRRFLVEHEADPVLLNNLGVLLTNAGQAGRGRSHFEKAIAILPGDRNVHENLRITDILLGRSRPMWHQIPGDLQPGDSTLVAYFEPQAM